MNYSLINVILVINYNNYLYCSITVWFHFFTELSHETTDGSEIQNKLYDLNHIMSQDWHNNPDQVGRRMFPSQCKWHFLWLFVYLLYHHYFLCTITKVSVQGVKSICGHFACLCREFDFYEVKKYVSIFHKEKGNTLTLLIIFYSLQRAK